MKDKQGGLGPTLERIVKVGTAYKGPEARKDLKGFKSRGVFMLMAGH